uniref:Uncharacterized protein n=1 Tax=Anguilla anguilla TaxID=7936 RepID=A0A0E9Q775_ANGAN
MGLQMQLSISHLEEKNVVKNKNLFEMQ